MNFVAVLYSGICPNCLIHFTEQFQENFGSGFGFGGVRCLVIEQNVTNLFK